MKIIHTSDWHLGKALYGRSRYEEFSAFLDWLCALIESEKADALLVAGDIFDTSVSSSRAQELYYRFLNSVARSAVCRHVVIISGNHDSPSFLEAPKALLRTLNVHVVGVVPEDPMDEVIVLRNAKGEAEAVVAAVPYLRDRDIRTVAPGEHPDEKNRKLTEGIERHYREVCLAAEQRRLQEGGGIPLIAMGHLFTAHGSTIEGDGVRELYAGALAHVPRSVFPAGIDYLALGHLHEAQKVAGEEHLRYSGAPIPMSFGEAGDRKSVIVVEFSDSKPSACTVPVPCFQSLERIVGTIESITQRIHELRSEGSNAWIEIDYTGLDVPEDLRNRFEEAIEGSSLEIRRIKTSQAAAFSLQQETGRETLEELSELDVFSRRLDAGNVPEAERASLLQAYREVLDSIREGENDAP
jgi:exonuclease SbcD